MLASGSDVGGIIGHPSLLDLVRADAVAPNSVSSTVHGSNGPAVNGHSNTRNGPPQKQSMNGMYYFSNSCVGSVVRLLK